MHCLELIAVMSRVRVYLSFLIVVLAPAVAAAGEVADKTRLPATSEAWLAQMLDAKKNGVAIKDPAAFAEWLDAVTEPRFMTALASVAVDPATYPKAMADAIDPAAAHNWSEFTDPQLYLRWLLASATPSFQQAIVSRITDPAKMQRWMEAVSRPDAFAPTLAQFGKAPSAWLQAPLAPANQASMTKLMQPTTPLDWFGAMATGIGRQVGGQEWRKLPVAATGTRYRY